MIAPQSATLTYEDEILLDTIPGVAITDDQSFAYNGFCYHVPAENSNLFNS